MRKLFGSLVVLLLVLTSCGTTVKVSDARVVYTENDVRSYTLVDLNIQSDRVSGVCADKKLTPSMRKTQAVANAMKAAGADVLIDPLYTYEGRGSNVVVTVTGYPAKYKNFRNAAVR